MPRNSPWKGFPHNFHALIWATCSRRNLRKWLRGAPGHCSSLCNRFRGFSQRSRFTQTLRASVGGVWKLWMHGSQLLLWAASHFFPKCWPIKELTRVWKLSLCARAPDRNYDISCFPIGPKANGDSGLYALSKALITFRFCTRIGPTEAQVLPCAPARNNVSIPSYRDVEVRRPEALRASVSRITIFIMPTLASVCSTEAVYRWWKFQSVPSEIKKLWALEDLPIRPIRPQ